MPKKACCCNQQISWPTSCCKPPEYNCIGSTVNISVDVYVKFYCEPNGNILIWKCLDGSQSPIEFETEHWRLNLTYTLSEEDVAPPLPSQQFQTEFVSTSYNPFSNIYSTGNTVNYYGGDGYLGGLFPYYRYATSGGEYPIKGTCKKCIDPCGVNTQVEGCVNFTWTNNSGDLITGCGIPQTDGGGGFPPQIYWDIIECSSCCNENSNYTIDFKEKYNACDMCNIGGPVNSAGGNRQGRYSLGVKTIDIGNSPFLSLLSTDISLRDNTSWTFDFIPSYDGQSSKLNIELLSCHFGCSDRGAPGVYINGSQAGSLPYYNDYTTHLVDLYTVKTLIPRYYDNICLSEGYCGISFANPNLVDNVCFAMTQYYNPPWYVDYRCDNTFDICACTAGPVGGGFGGGCPGGNPNDVFQSTVPSSFFGGIQKYFLTNCGCSCGEPGTCYRWYHRYASPDDILRPHELSLELGIGYRNTAPCGEEIQMDFYEEMYKIDLFDTLSTPVKIEKILTASTGVRYVNPEWVQGIQLSGGNEPTGDFQYYNYYSQGTRLKLTYTRNSIPYEKYNHNNIENNCIPETIIGGITGFTAQNKIYPEYPEYGHPNMVDHPQGIYEGEYALSKVSYWAPSVNATYDILGISPTQAPGQTYGPQQPMPPAGISGFYQCYPFNNYSTTKLVVPYPYTSFDSSLSVDTDDPLSKQGYPFTYQYSYGDITAIVRQI